MRVFTAVIVLCVSALNAQTTSIRILPIELSDRPAALSHAISFSCTTDYDPIAMSYERRVAGKGSRKVSN